MWQLGKLGGGQMLFMSPLAWAAWETASMGQHSSGQNIL